MANKNDFVYELRFWDVTQEKADAWVAAWTELLPLTDAGSYETQTELYGFNSGKGGALAIVERIEAGWGPYSPADAPPLGLSSSSSG
jgi:hypothetical protein